MRVKGFKVTDRLFLDGWQTLTSNNYSSFSFWYYNFYKVPAFCWLVVWLWPSICNNVKTVLRTMFLWSSCSRWTTKSRLLELLFVFCATAVLCFSDQIRLRTRSLGFDPRSLKPLWKRVPARRGTRCFIERPVTLLFGCWSFRWLIAFNGHIDIPPVYCPSSSVASAPTHYFTLTLNKPNGSSSTQSCSEMTLLSRSVMTIKPPTLFKLTHWTLMETLTADILEGSEGGRRTAVTW